MARRRGHALGPALRSLAAPGAPLGEGLQHPSLQTSRGHLVIVDHVDRVEHPCAQTRGLKLLLHVRSLTASSQKTTKVPFVVLAPFTDEDIGAPTGDVICLRSHCW